MAEVHRIYARPTPKPNWHAASLKRVQVGLTDLQGGFVPLRSCATSVELEVTCRCAAAAGVGGLGRSRAAARSARCGVGGVLFVFCLVSLDLPVEALDRRRGVRSRAPGVLVVGRRAEVPEQRVEVASRLDV